VKKIGALVLVIGSIYMSVTAMLGAFGTGSSMHTQNHVMPSIIEVPPVPTPITSFVTKDHRADLRPLFEGIQKTADPESWSRISVDFDSLVQKDPVTLPFGLNGSDVVFENYKIDSTPSTTTYSGTLEIAGKNQPITISKNVSGVFASIPTANGVIEGRGSQGNIVFKRRPVFTDLVDHPHMHPKAGNGAKLLEDICLNC
jgi:hypothetical protein